MSNQKFGLVMAGVIAIVVIAGAFFMMVGNMQPAGQTRVEEPYVRTEEQPPSAVTDETSAPALQDQPQGR